MNKIEAFNSSILRSIIREIKKNENVTGAYLSSIGGISEQLFSDFMRGNRELSCYSINRIFQNFNIDFDSTVKMYENAKIDFLNLLDFLFKKKKGLEEEIKKYLKNEKYHYSNGYYYYHLVKILNIILFSKKQKDLKFEYELLSKEYKNLTNEVCRTAKTLLYSASYMSLNFNIEEYAIFACIVDFSSIDMDRQEYGLAGLYYYFSAFESYKNGLLDDAILKCNRALDFYLTGGYLIRVIDCKICLGNFYICDNKYNLAYSIYESAFEMATQIIDPTNIQLKCKINMAYALIFMNQFNKSIEILKVITDKNKDYPNIALNLCAAYFFENDKEKFKITVKEIYYKKCNKSQKILADLFYKIVNETSCNEIEIWYKKLLENDKNFEKQLLLKILISYASRCDEKDSCIYFQQQFLRFE